MSETIAKVSNRKLVVTTILLVCILISGSLWWWIRSNSRVSTDDARVKGTMTSVSPKVAGRIKELLVAEGDNVKAGQIIAKLENQEYKNQVAQAEANLAVAEANLAVAKAKLTAIMSGNRPQEIAQAGAKVQQEEAIYKNTASNYMRDNDLFAQGAISSQKLDSSKASFLSAKAEYESANEQYSLSKEGARSEDIAVVNAGRSCSE